MEEAERFEIASRLTRAVASVGLEMGAAEAEAKRAIRKPEEASEAVTGQDVAGKDEEAYPGDNWGPSEGGIARR
jgi:hypothetical protein